MDCQWESEEELMGSDLHIIGVIRLHRFEVEIERVLSSLAGFCDGLYVLTDNVSPRIWNALMATPKVKAVNELGEPWTQAGSLDKAFRLLDRIKPDVVLMPDEDELLPEKLPLIIEAWRRVWDHRPSIGFPVLHSIGDPDTILSRKLYSHHEHCKVIRWSPGISYLNGYAGWCWPSSHFRQKKYHSAYPYRHLAFMTPTLRAMRSAGIKHRHWFARDYFPTIQYDPEMTWKEWSRISGPYTIERTAQEVSQIKTMLDLFQLLRIIRRPDVLEVAASRGIVQVNSSRVYYMQQSFPQKQWKPGEQILACCGKRSGILRIAG